MTESNVIEFPLQEEVDVNDLLVEEPDRDPNPLDGMDEEEIELVMNDLRSKPTNHRHFWNPTKNGLVINEYLLKKFLTKEGFGQFQFTQDRTARKTIFHNDEGILKVHDATSIKNWVLEFLEDVDEDEFIKDNTFDCTSENGGEPIFKDMVLNKFQKFPTKTMDGNVLKSLPVFSESSFERTQLLNLFDDTKDSANLRFINGVVQITKDNMKLIPYDEFDSDGAIWESAIIQRNIKIDKEKGLFETFAKDAMKKKVPLDKSKIGENNDPDGIMEALLSQNPEFELDEDQYESLRTAYGYLIHTHNRPDLSKCIFFIDADSDLGHARGGNGKSLIMKSIEHLKNVVSVNGKGFRQNSDGGGRFQFSMVNADTKLIVIDDVDKKFNFENLFVHTTGDMEIERKGKDIVIIPANKKPKLAVNTNYVMSGVGTSHTRRQHIVEFGNYWNHVNENGESPADEKHLGKTLFGYEFTDDDWNQFYTYGFRCVQDYLKKGLVESSNENHLKKSRKVSIEGIDGDGVVTSWMERWLETTRIENKYHIGNGISEDEIWNQFSDYNSDYTKEYGGIWDKKKFLGGLFSFVQDHPDYEWNKHLAHKGSGRSDRRWLVGERGNQKPMMKITNKVR